jgi:hypothetical protein
LVYRKTNKCLISIDGKTRITIDNIPQKSFTILKQDIENKFKIGNTYYLNRGITPAIYYGVLYPFRRIFISISDNRVISISDDESESIEFEPKAKSLCIIL